MTQIKFVLLTLISIASLNANADVMSGLLDLNNLYGNTNAGRYYVGLALNIEKSAPVVFAQRLGDPQFADQPGSEAQVCVTDFYLIAGQARLMLNDELKEETLNANVTISWATTHYDETEDCTPVAQLVKNGLEFTPYINFGSLKLNYKAPYDYEDLFSAIAVFPYGNSVKLKITGVKDGVHIIGNLQKQLSSQLKRGNKKALTHYTYAQKDQTQLSLGQGQVELK